MNAQQEDAIHLLDYLLVHVRVAEALVMLVCAGLSGQSSRMERSATSLDTLTSAPIHLPGLWCSTALTRMHTR
jgi:hypothetical protein